MRSNAFLVLMMALATVAAAQTWEIETIEWGRHFGLYPGCSLSLDADYHPHMAYGGDRLSYARFDGITWHVEIASLSWPEGEYLPEGAYREASLALTSTGDPRISFSGTGYAFRDAAGWHMEYVSVERGSSTSSLAIDSSDHARICFSGYGTLEYAWDDSAGWHVEIVDPEAYAEYGVSMALDASDNPHIGYCHHGQLKYAYRTSMGAHAEWRVETLEAERFCWFGSLAVDGFGNPHLIYYRGEDLEHAWYDGAGWHFETVESGVYIDWPPFSSSISVDSSGLIHACYVDGYGASHLKYAYRDAFGWHVQSVAVLEVDTGTFYCSLGLDATDKPRIAYFDWIYRSMTYTYFDEAGWRFETVDRGGDVGLGSSLALDVSDLPHVSYFDGRTGDLRYACVGPLGWHAQTVDTLLYPDLHTSIALDSSGYPHISYRDYAGENLKYAYQDAEGWHVEVADDEGNVGWGSSLALDASGRPHISYGRSLSSHVTALRYAYEDGAGWVIETADNQVPTIGYGCLTSLALDSSGLPCISYNGSLGLRYAFRDAVGWQVQPVDTDANAGAYSCLALGSGGNPHVSYHANRLRYAYRDAAGWHIQTVDGYGGGAGVHTALAIDDADNPRISYGIDADLKYAYEDATGWHQETLDTQGDVGYFTSLALDNSQCPHISYMGNYDLKYARLIPAAGDPFATEPGMIRLVSVAPNPFSGATELSWEQGSPAMVDASVFDLLGRKVAVIAEGEAEQGVQQLTWRPVGLRSGVYVLRVSFNGATAAMQPLIYRR